MEHAIRNAVIYARYSSHAQREESIAQQVDVCRRWCEANGYDVLRTYADEARSGRSTAGRDAFLQMVDDARDGAFSAVVVYKLDRFSRDRYDAAIYRKRLRDAGVEVRSAMESIPDGPEGRLLEAVVEGVAEWYSADLSQKTVRGMRAGAERCRALGVAVYGYRIGDDGRYEVDEAQAAIVRRVFSEWIAGDDATLIARRLASEGVRTATGARPDKNWARRVVHDERYIGVYVWADVRVEGGMPAIVDAATFHEASKRRRAAHAPQRVHDYPLVGRLWDRESRSKAFGYSVRAHGRDYCYYAFKTAQGRVTVPRDAVDAAVARAVRSALMDAALVDEVVARVLELDGEPVEGLEDARRALDAVEAERIRLGEAVLAGVAPADLAEAFRDVRERKRAAEAAVAALEAPPLAAEDVRDAIRDMATGGLDDAALLAGSVYRVELVRNEGAVVVELPFRKKNAPREQGVREKCAWLPLGTSGAKWAVVPGALLLRCELAA